MLAVRRALLDSTFEEVLSGCENYKTYCQASGIEGSSFVQAPQRFIEDGSFLEEFTYKAAEDPRIAEQKSREAARRSKVESAARLAGIGFDIRDSTASIQTSIDLAASRGNGSGAVHPEVSGRISELTARMRIAK